MDDDEMVIIYARENATQRGAEGTAMGGAVAAAIKADREVDREGRAILSWIYDKIGRFYFAAKWPKATAALDKKAYSPIL